MLKKLYVVLALAILTTYAWADFNGYELQTSKRDRIPQSMRGRQGGARAFWVGGYRGGK